MPEPKLFVALRKNTSQRAHKRPEATQTAHDKPLPLDLEGICYFDNVNGESPGTGRAEGFAVLDRKPMSL